MNFLMSILAVVLVILVVAILQLVTDDNFDWREK